MNTYELVERFKKELADLNETIKKMRKLGIEAEIEVGEAKPHAAEHGYPDWVEINLSTCGKFKLKSIKQHRTFDV